MAAIVVVRLSSSVYIRELHGNRDNGSTAVTGTTLYRVGQIK